MVEFRDFYSIMIGDAKCVALVGGGGKTSLMYAIADYAKDFSSVICTTSTKIKTPSHMPCMRRVGERLSEHTLICVAEIAKNGKQASPEQSFDELMKLSGLLIVEADGSKRLPLKTHASWEPAIPECAEKVLAVVGLWGIGEPIIEVVHRPQLFAERFGKDVNDNATASDVMINVLAYPKVSGLVLNGADDEERQRLAQKMAAMTDLPVAITKLKDATVISEIWRSGKCLLS